MLQWIIKNVWNKLKKYKTQQRNIRYQEPNGNFKKWKIEKNKRSSTDRINSRSEGIEKGICEGRRKIENRIIQYE